jgi:hypothetical protein
LNAGANRHVFTAERDSCDLLWFTFVKLVNSSLWAQRFKDCKVNGIAFDFPTSEVVNVSLDVIGLDADHADPATVVPVYEDSPLLTTVTGYAKLYDDAGAELVGKATRVSIGFSNGATGDEWVIGSPVMDDVTPRSRSLSVAYDLIISDSDLFRSMQYGSKTGTAWSGIPMEGQLSIKSESYEMIPKTGGGFTTKPYGVQIDIPRMVFIPGPVTLAGDNIISMPLSAAGLLPDAGSPFTVTVENCKADYSTS